jgi:hypothetical protein
MSISNAVAFRRMKRMMLSLCEPPHIFQAISIPSSVDVVALDDFVRVGHWLGNERFRNYVVRVSVVPSRLWADLETLVKSRVMVVRRRQANVVGMNYTSCLVISNRQSFQSPAWHADIQ